MQRIQSTRIGQLSQQASNDPTALDQFWQGVAESGAPLIEPIEDDPEHVLVTFLWRATISTQNVVIISRINADHHILSPDYFLRNQMTQVPGTDLWYKSYRLPNDLFTAYQLSVNDSLLPLAEEKDIDARFDRLQADPLNPRSLGTQRGSVYSILLLPNAPRSRWATERAQPLKGTLTQDSFKSTLMGNQRTVWIYRPPNPDPANCPLLILLDGKAYLQGMQVASLLDNMIAGGAIPPLYVAFVDSIDGMTRSNEMTCNLHFADFLAMELMPWLAEHLATKQTSEQTLLAGHSLGGLTAAYVALCHPETFGTVLAQSGAFNFEPFDQPDFVGIMQRFEESPRLPIRFHLDVGTLEIEPSYRQMSLLDASRQMRALLEREGYTVHYREYPGGHDYVYWSSALADALQLLL